MSRPETHVLRPAVAPVDLNQHPVRLANLVAQYMGRAPNGNSPWESLGIEAEGIPIQVITAEKEAVESAEHAKHGRVP
jgi:hypothetical protein